MRNNLTKTNCIVGLAIMLLSSALISLAQNTSHPSATAKTVKKIERYLEELNKIG